MLSEVDQGNDSQCRPGYVIGEKDVIVDAPIPSPLSTKVPSLSSIFGSTRAILGRFPAFHSSLTRR